MYETFFGLTERPFSLLPDPDFLYMSPQHKLARAYLEYGLTQKLGFVVLTGAIGTGKTTLIKSLLRARAGKQRIGVLYQTSFGAEDLLELLLKEFEIQGDFHSRATRLSAFNEFLIKAYGRGENVVLIVDEAHNLGAAALEELRLLSNLQADKEPLLQVILVGQPRLRERLRQPSLRQLAQRVGIHFHLQPLDEEETKEYIRYRLARAGGSDIFTPSANEKIYACTQGVPRRINAWCDLALVAAFAEGRKEIDREFLETVVAAQYETLEGPDRDESGSKEGLSAGPEEQGDQSTQFLDSPGELAGEGSGDGNHLRREVRELSACVSKLESMVLDLTGKLLPALNKLSSNLPPEPQDQASPAPPPPTPLQEPETKNEESPKIIFESIQLTPARRSLRKIIGVFIGAGLLVSLAAYVIYAGLPRTLLNFLQEQTSSLQASPTSQTSKKHKRSGAEASPASQPDIHSERSMWTPSISYQVTSRDNSLSKIVATHYPDNQEVGFAAVILANPQITRENIIYHGQRLLLPQINKSNKIIKLKDNLYYMLYDNYNELSQLNKDTSMMKDMKIRYLVRETQDPSAQKMYRVYLGGYKDEEKLIEAVKMAE